jgi:glycosyltransferase involved in cell wall biosynthesis
MGKHLSIILLRVEDFLRTNNAAGVFKMLQAPAILMCGGPLARIKAWIEIATYYPRTSIGELAISKANALTKRYLYHFNQVEHTQISRSVIIKPFVSEKEPGFLLVSFEQNLENILSLRSFAQFSAQYRIIFLPTWQPFYTTAACLLAARSQETFFIMPSAFSEEDLCHKFTPLCHFLPFHAASWVHGDFYDTPCSTKTIDILMLANFSKYKRHWRLFEALSDLPNTLRVTLAGMPWGGHTRDSLLKEAHLFGVDKQITIVEGTSDQTIRDFLSRSRLLCAMSVKEGSYIAVAEALMAGTPVAMFRTAKIGTRSYINRETGFFLTADRPLGPQLAEILRRCGSINPQAWAKKNFSARANCKRLNALLQRWSEEQGFDWSDDIEPFFSRHFEFEYMDPESEERLRPEYQRVKDQFGLSIRRN